LITKQARLNRPEQLSSEDQVRYLLLKMAESEIKATGKISDELKEEMFSDARLLELWETAKKEYKEFLTRRTATSAEQMKEGTDANAAFRARLLLGTTRQGVHVLGREHAMVLAESARYTHDLVAVPAPNLDIILRADAAAERALNRAIDRLERLQCRRLGETVPPPVSVRVTR
jgi:hypothetical protein